MYPIYLSHPNEQYAYVVHDLDPHALVRVGHLQFANMSLNFPPFSKLIRKHLVERHAVELDGLGILAKLEVYVAHVDAQAAGVVEHPVLGDYLV